MKKEKEVDLYGLQTGEAVLLQIDGKMSNLNLFQKKSHAKCSFKVHKKALIDFHLPAFNNE